ncbi:NAD-dependent epimerase/dehydratase family protein [Nonomuraea purpurea]|uniref:NAD-dependent epimerase/dehydratase family protein n=1 Tax=Nonomuraea purpurea TaxID=1849276 RepID=A0ABV8G9R4_9ACTN
MRVILFGATGMIGGGVLRECLLDDRVSAVLSVGRAATGVSGGKLREIVHGDLLDLGPIEAELAGYDACFFCLEVSSAGMSEPAYRRVTHDFTLSVAATLARLSPGSTFVYVSSADARDRVTENALLALPLSAYVFRPGYVRPVSGSRTRFYRLAYVVTRPVFPVVRRLFPTTVTTTERIGQAMINVAERGAGKRVLGPADINALAS